MERKIGSDQFYKDFILPVLDRVDSETMHHRTKRLLHRAEGSRTGIAVLEALNYQGSRFYDDRLGVDIGNLHLDNPVIVGGGWDKEGQAVGALHTLGFAGVEVGTVLENPQPGNEKPRQFAKGGVALNRLGFNSCGMEKVAHNLARYRDPESPDFLRFLDGRRIPIGINVGKNKETPDSDAPRQHAAVVSRLGQYADWVTINVSSPNTPGLRRLQDKGPLTDIVHAVQEQLPVKNKRPIPLFIKVAPDLTLEALDDVIGVAVDNKVTGIIASNTTINPELKGQYGWRDQAGGLSGDDEEFRRMSTEQIAHMYSQTRGRLKIIGIGGVKDTATALEKMLAGADAVQVVTAIRGEGWSVAGRINRGMASFLDHTTESGVHHLVGLEAHNYPNHNFVSLARKFRYCLP